MAEATAAIWVFSGALSDWLGRRKLLAALGYGLAAVTSRCSRWRTRSAGWWPRASSTASARASAARRARSSPTSPRRTARRRLRPAPVAGHRRRLSRPGAGHRPDVAHRRQHPAGVLGRGAAGRRGGRPDRLRRARCAGAVRKGACALSRAELAQLPSRYWWVVAASAVFTWRASARPSWCCARRSCIWRWR